MLSHYSSKESDRRGSNPRPQPWQGCTLPAEPLSHIFNSLSEQYIIYTTFVRLSTLFFNFFKFSQIFLFFILRLFLLPVLSLIPTQQAVYHPPDLVHLSSDKMHLLLSGMPLRHGCCLLLPSA